MNQEKLFEVIRAPLVTEKTARANAVNQYAFKVDTTASKADIKSAVEALFGVTVLAVQTLNMAGKARRFRGIAGRRNHWKKAYVTLAEGQTIEFGQPG